MNKQRKAVSRFLLRVLLITTAWTAFTATEGQATTVSEVEEEKAKAEEDYENAGKAIENLEQGREKLASETEELGQELTDLLVNISILEDDMAELKKQIAKTDKEYQAARQRQVKQYEVMKKRIQFLYEEGNITYLDILLKSKNIGDLVRETEYARQLYEYDRDMILDYEEVRQDVIARQERLEMQKSEMETMKEEYAAQKASLEETIDTRKNQLTNFDTKLAAAKEKAEEYARTVQEKTEQIRKLRAEEELRRQQEISRQLQERQRAMTRGYQDGTPIKSTGGTEFGRSVADYALQFVGNPYVWGGTSLTNGADCSGFTQSVYRHFGVSIPRTSGEQANYGKEIAYEDMEPGDLICYSGHVSMYIGGGRIVHAASAKAGICVTDDPAYRTIVSIRRPWQ